MVDVGEIRGILFISSLLFDNGSIAGKFWFSSQYSLPFAVSYQSGEVKIFRWNVWYFIAYLSTWTPTHKSANGTESWNNKHTTKYSGWAFSRWFHMLYFCKWNEKNNFPSNPFTQSHSQFARIYSIHHIILPLTYVLIFGGVFHTFSLISNLNRRWDIHIQSN